MKYKINEEEYEFIKNIKDNERVRKSFNSLVENTFGINFETWFQRGYWRDKYIPYVLLKDGKVVSNVSVNIINIKYNDDTKFYIQLGTIMTDKEYRNKGLSRFLIEKVLADWEDNCDAIYLFANNGVLNFYPKFGFEKASEYQYIKMADKKGGVVKKLDINSEEDRSLLLDLYKFSNQFSALSMENNEGLLMFYCSQSMSENIYYIEKYESIVVAEYIDKSMLCYDIFSKGKCTIDNILDTMVQENTKVVTFGFTPKLRKNFKVREIHEEDTTLFILKKKENLFSLNKLMFPLLSHA